MPPGWSRGQYQFTVSCQAQPVFTTVMFYDQFAATSEKGLAGNLLLPRVLRRIDNRTSLFLLHVWSQVVHIQMITILIYTVNETMRKA